MSLSARRNVVKKLMKNIKTFSKEYAGKLPSKRTEQKIQHKRQVRYPASTRITINLKLNYCCHGKVSGKGAK